MGSALFAAAYRSWLTAQEQLIKKGLLSHQQSTYGPQKKGERLWSGKSKCSVEAERSPCFSGSYPYNSFREPEKHSDRKNIYFWSNTITRAFPYSE